MIWSFKGKCACTKRNKGNGVKIKCTMESMVGRQLGVEVIGAEEVQSEIDLREEPTPEMDGKEGINRK